MAAQKVKPMITDAETNFVYFSDILPRNFPPLFDELSGLLRDAGIGVGLIPDTWDIWCRDYMPIQITKDRFVQFKYWPDYLLDEYQDTITPSDVIRAAIPVGKTCEKSKIILDGGNVVRWSNKVIMTDKVLEGVPERDKDARQRELWDLLEVEQLIIVPREPEELYGHADGIVRFIDEDSVIVNDYSGTDPGYREDLLATLEEAGLACVPIPYKPKEPTRNKQPATGVYTNFLRTSKITLVAHLRRHTSSRA